MLFLSHHDSMETIVLCKSAMESLLWWFLSLMLTQSTLINDGVIELLSLIEFCNAADPAESRVRVREESSGNKDGPCSPLLVTDLSLLLRSHSAPEVSLTLNG